VETGTAGGSGAFPAPAIYLCSLCGSALLEEERLQTCTYCGTEEECEWLCPQGHYVCEDCRAASPEEIIERTSLATSDPDPVAITELIMKHAVFREHGPAHHLLVAPVILAALRNQGHPAKDSSIRAALHRMKDIPVAVCGTRGDCGAAVGLGCAVSLLTGATFRSDHERSQALRATARALVRVAENGGPRCCKQSVYATLEAAALFLNSELGIAFATPGHIRCPFSHTTEECKKERCAYFPED
jgi:DNA-directed RNA polymerase subunit RPC12/RpoP